MSHTCIRNVTYKKDFTTFGKNKNYYVDQEPGQLKSETVRGGIPTIKQPLFAVTHMPLKSQVVSHYQHLGLSSINGRKERVGAMPEKILTRWRDNLNFPTTSLQAIKSKYDSPQQH